MEKFARFLLVVLFLFAGCATVQMPYLSRTDHVYNKKIEVGFEKAVSSMVYVLKQQGWKVVGEADPSTYERDEEYDNNGYQNLLLMTNIKKIPLHVSGVRLNVLIHSIDNSSDIEIRSSEHNDRLVQGLWDALDQAIK